jgi:hypothetical protein
MKNDEISEPQVKADLNTSSIIDSNCSFLDRSATLTPQNQSPPPIPPV